MLLKSIWALKTESTGMEEQLPFIASLLKPSFRGKARFQVTLFNLTITRSSKVPNCRQALK